MRGDSQSILISLNHYFRLRGTMSSSFGTPIKALSVPSPCLKYMPMLTNRHQRMLTRMAILDPPKAKTSARDPVSLEVLRAKAATLSQKTSPQLVQSVVATTTRLRNATPLSTLWKCTCIPWDEDTPTKVDNHLKHTSIIWQPQDVPTLP